MTRLSVNINKVATLRNARGGELPNVMTVAGDCERFGAHGITVHPRPDERHIRYSDVWALKPIVQTEFNIEGYPADAFMDLVLQIRPHQVTLVPDAPDALTSNAGWDVVNNKQMLCGVIEKLKNANIRTSLFLDPLPRQVACAFETGTDRIELYTEQYARGFSRNPEMAVQSYLEAAVCARQLGLGLNAGHDLNLDNLNYFVRKIPWTAEVSIGHALVCDALYFGLENTIQLYLKALSTT